VRTLFGACDEEAFNYDGDTPGPSAPPPGSAPIKPSCRQRLTQGAKKRLALEASLHEILQALSVTLFEQVPILQAFHDADPQGKIGINF